LLRKQLQGKPTIMMSHVQEYQMLHVCKSCWVWREYFHVSSRLQPRQWCPRGVTRATV